VADGVLICTPEYAFGIPGVLKNALDWTVSSGELNEKPVAAISASPLYTGGEKALASLRLTLSALGAEDGGHLSIPSLHKVFNGNKEIADPETLQSLSRLLASFMRSMDEKAKPGL
jgi:NAD(P)H-dependent FMN reductase